MSMNRLTRALFSGCVVSVLVSACGGARIPATPSVPTTEAMHAATATPASSLATATRAPTAAATVAAATAAATPAPLNTQYPPAPPIQSATWVNSDPLAWDSLRGQVVLVEFWTFDCINCRHVIPFLRGIDKDYRARGLTLIGVHSPEFDYEHVLTNVQDAVRKMGIQYPVAIDNDFANWNRYHNLAWPTIYLVDKHGLIRYSHVGEEGYDETRQWIERLLQE